MRISVIVLSILSQLTVAHVTTGVLESDDYPDEIIFEIASTKVGDFDFFLLSRSVGRETHFYGGVSNDKHAMTLVFLGSVGRELLVSGGLASSTVASDMLPVFWTDGHCGFATDALSDSREVTARNMNQLMGQGEDELFIGLGLLARADHAHPVIVRNLAPFFAGLTPELPGNNRVEVVPTDDPRLLHLLWDQIEARYWQAVAELEATDEALRRLIWAGGSPTPDGDR